MRKIIVLYVIILSTSIVLGQSKEERISALNAQKRSLQNQIEILKAQIKEIDKKIAEINNPTPKVTTQNNSNVIIVSNSSGLIAATVGDGGGVFRDAPSTNGRLLSSLKAGESIYLYKEVNGMYVKAKYYGRDGWVNYTSLKHDPAIDELFNINQSPKVNAKAGSTTIIRQVDTNSPKYKRLAKLYGHEKAMAIMNHEVTKGMSHGMVIESLGKALSKKNVNTPKGLRETWTYSDKEVIFLNGEVSKVISK